MHFGNIKSDVSSSDYSTLAVLLKKKFVDATSVSMNYVDVYDVLMGRS